MFKLNTKFDADSLPYPLSHFEWNGHRVYMLTQRHLLPPLTSIVKSSLFTHVTSSPFSLAASLHRCCTNILVILKMAGLFLDSLYMTVIFFSLISCVIWLNLNLFLSQRYYQWHCLIMSLNIWFWYPSKVDKQMWMTELQFVFRRKC